MKRKINLVTVIGYVPEIFEHFYNHYKDLVDNFYIIVHRTDDFDPILKSVNKCGLTPYKILDSEKCNFYDISSSLNETIKTKPDEWWIVADADEFQLYPKDLHEIIDECDSNGYKVIPGILLDRVGEDFSFPKISKQSLWDTFPYCGYFRTPVTNACEFKSCIVKGEVELETGQHFPTINGMEITNNEFKKSEYIYPPKNGVVQVHHFKWDYYVFERLKLLVDLKKEYTFWQEHQTMYNFVTSNNLNLKNKDFYFQKDVKKFDDYKFWNILIKKLIK